MIFYNRHATDLPATRQADAKERIAQLQAEALQAHLANMRNVRICPRTARWLGMTAGQLKVAAFALEQAGVARLQASASGVTLFLV